MKMKMIPIIILIIPLTILVLLLIYICRKSPPIITGHENNYETGHLIQTLHYSDGSTKVTENFNIIPPTGKAMIIPGDAGNIIFRSGNAHDDLSFPIKGN